MARSAAPPGAALEDLAAALRSLGAPVDQVGGPPAPDVVLVRPGPGAPAVAVRVVGRARAGPAEMADLLARPRPGGGPVTVVVADLVPGRARDLLREAGWGWLDRRGHLRLQAPGMLVETAVPPSVRPRTSARRPVSGRGGLTWACALLLEPERPPALRELARRAGMAPSTLSVAAGALREAGLVDGRGRPRLPELFWEVADAWRPAWVPVATPPAGGHGVAAGARAARAHGAPPAPSPGSPGEGVLELYVADEAQLARVVREGGRCHPGLEAARVAVSPTPLVEATAELPEGGGRPVEAAVFAALDLTSQPGGAALLVGWAPPPGRRHVWTDNHSK